MSINWQESIINFGFQGLYDKNLKIIHRQKTVYRLSKLVNEFCQRIDIDIPKLQIIKMLKLRHNW